MTRRRPLVAWVLGLELAVALGSVLFFWLDQRPLLLPLLARALAEATPGERWLVIWTACAQTLTLLAPVLLLGGACAWRGRERLALHAFALGGAGVLSFASLDLAIYLAFGRHLAEVLGFLFVPGAANGAGGSSVWLLAVGRTLLFIGFASYVLTGAALWAATRATARASASVAWALAGLGAAVLLALAGAPRFLTPLYRHAPLGAGLEAAALWGRPRFGSARFEEPGWSELARGLSLSYGRQFPRLFSERPWRVTPPPGAERPSVLVIVVESWRADALSAEQMPRSAAWAERGLLAQQHYAGSDYSEAGMFALYYGRSPLLYHATLDAKEPPPLCALGHAVGLRCAYYSGQPTTWMRAEEFISARQIDRFVHDDTGSWNDWDRRALHNAVTDLNDPGQGPQLAVVYLMSTHFEYRYPPEFERHTPVATGTRWLTADPAALGPADVEPLKNRYANALAFTDAIVADAIAALDPHKTLVVLTGDHGEAFGEASHFSHGNGFGDSVSRVPFALVGPGVPPARYREPSTHADLLPTLAHALGVPARFAAEARDLLAEPRARPGLLLAHCSFSRDAADALWLSPVGRLRLELDLRRPSVELKGMEDTEGRPLGRPALTPGQVSTLVNGLDAALSEL